MVIPHLLVPELRDAILSTPAHRILVMNITAADETDGFTASRHIELLAEHLLLLKNTRIVAQLLTMIMRENGVPEPDCRILIADLQRARRKSVQRAMSQAATLKVDVVFDNPALFVSGEYEAAAIHDSH